MPSRKPARRKSPRKQPVATPAGTSVACWEDDPGDPKSQPALSPINVPVPNQSAPPLPYKLLGKAPSPQAYQPGTLNFVYYATASALRRTATFWGSIVPAGTHWQVGKVLPVNIDSGVDLNAFYTRGGGGDSPGLHFFHDSVAGRIYFSGESPDVCCHEMGHAVLDALRPQLFDAQTIEAAAFHESFGDMSALLSALQVPSFRQTLLSETGGTINRASRLSRLAEQLGAAIRIGHPDAVDPDCLRNAVNSFFYTDPQALPPSAPASHLSSEPHSFSRVFTGGFFDALAGIFKLQGNPTSDGLVQSAQDIAHLLVTAVLNASVVPDYYSQVAAQLVQAGEGVPFNGKYRDVLKSAFVRRGILSLQAAATLGGLGKEAARTLTMAAGGLPPLRARQLPLSTISAVQYGLRKPVLRVYTASEPKHLAVTGSSFLVGPAEPRSAQSGAESYTEDLFQRGHVDVGKHAQASASVLHPYSFKTHALVEEHGELILRRTTFDCGFHFAFDQS
jgi:hypothetical protein